MQNLYLIGFMGSGKSTVSKELAKKLNMKLVDMDQIIEKEQDKTIADIFESDGENFFRGLETKLLIKLGAMDNQIISTGGGVVMRSENVQAMKASGKIIYLQASAEHLYQFLKHDSKRPLLKTKDPFQTIKTLLGNREPYYMQAADIIIQCSGKNISEISDEIIEIL